MKQCPRNAMQNAREQGSKGFQAGYGCFSTAVIGRSLNQSVCYHLREIRQTVVEFNVSEKENFMPEYKHKDKFHGIKTPSPPPPLSLIHI